MKENLQRTDPEWLGAVGLGCNEAVTTAQSDRHASTFQPPALAESDCPTKRLPNARVPAGVGFAGILEFNQPQGWIDGSPRPPTVGRSKPFESNLGEPKVGSKPWKLSSHCDYLVEFGQLRKATEKRKKKTRKKSETAVPDRSPIGLLPLYPTALR